MLKTHRIKLPCAALVYAGLASASDGDKDVFSRSKLFSSPVDDGVIVFLEKDGPPLTDDQARIAMISSKSLRSGPRHVKWLQAQAVRKVVE